jgi:hypothetical protein
VSPARRRLWLLALCLYIAAAALDFASHLRGEPRTGIPEVLVGFTASLFWPLDLVAAYLLRR